MCPNTVSHSECNAREILNAKLKEKLESGQMEFTLDETMDMGIIRWEGVTRTNGRSEAGFESVGADQYIYAGDKYYTPDGNYRQPTNTQHNSQVAPYVPSIRIGENCVWDSLKVNDRKYCGWGLDYFGGNWDREVIYQTGGRKEDLTSPQAHLSRKSNQYVPLGSLITGGKWLTWNFGPTGGPAGQIVRQDTTIEWRSQGLPDPDERPCGNLDPWCTGVPEHVRNRLRGEPMPRPDATLCMDPLYSGCNDIDMGSPSDSIYRKSEARSRRSKWRPLLRMHARPPLTVSTSNPNVAGVPIRRASRMGDLLAARSAGGAMGAQRGKPHHSSIKGACDGVAAEGVVLVGETTLLLRSA